jgi:hypothetical protein
VTSTFVEAAQSPILPWKAMLTAMSIDAGAWRLHVEIVGDAGAGEVSVVLQRQGTTSDLTLTVDEVDGAFELPLGLDDGRPTSLGQPLAAGRYDVRVSVAGSGGVQQQRLEVPVGALGDLAEAHLELGAVVLTPYMTATGGLALRVGPERAQPQHQLRLDTVRTIAVRDRANGTVKVRLDLQQLPAGATGIELRLQDASRTVKATAEVDATGVLEATVPESKVTGGTWVISARVPGYDAWLGVGGSLFVVRDAPVAVLYGPPASGTRVPVHAWERTGRARGSADLTDRLAGASRSMLGRLPKPIAHHVRRGLRRLARAAGLR